MRTSHLQYAIMVEFMERNGDLSKPSGVARGRHFVQIKWKELSDKLNSEGTGDSRSEEKWRKVWSDLKNNTKKKWAKINRAASGTGGGPALQLSLTDLENRVMQIIGVQAATGMAVVEAGFQQCVGDTEATPTPDTQPEETNSDMLLLPEDATEDWNTPGTSSQPTVAPPASRSMVPPMDEWNTAADSQPNVASPANRRPPQSPSATDVEEPWKPSVPKKKKTDPLTKLFVETERSAREYARERDVAFERLETERLRLHDYEIRERVRQRDQELYLQAQWLEFMKEAMNVIVRYFERENK